MRVAFVGTGGVAQRHLGVLSTLPEVELVAHVSADQQRAEAQATRWGGRAATDLTSMLEREAPDAVWVCVTPDRHGALELELIERNVPFFVEKPLAIDLRTAQRIGERLAAGGPIVAVGYKFRALDTLPRVRELLSETPPRMVIGAWHDALPPPHWWREAARGGGQMVEQATHIVDLARLLVGDASVVSAMAARWPRRDIVDSEVPDVTAALLRFETPAGDVPGVFSATDLLHGHAAIHLQLICEGRLLTLSERALAVDTGRERHEFTTQTDPFLEENLAFLRAIRERDPSLVLSSYADALETHRVCCAIRGLAERD